MIALLACTQAPVDPFETWATDPAQAVVQLEALPEDERGLVIMGLIEAHPGQTEALCPLASGVVRERCERLNSRPHLYEKERRTPPGTTLWRLPAPAWTDEDDPAPSCSSHAESKWVEDCYFEAAEAAEDLAFALTLCRGARATSGQCASHVLMPRWSDPPEQVLPAIDEALGADGGAVVALYWAGHAERASTAGTPQEFLNNTRALGGRPLREVPPAWRRVLDGEDWRRIPIHSSRVDVRPSVEDSAVDRVLAELFAEFLTTGRSQSIAAHAGHAEPVVRWSVALLLGQLDPGHAALSELQDDPDSRVAVRAGRS